MSVIFGATGLVLSGATRLEKLKILLFPVRGEDLGTVNLVCLDALAMLHSLKSLEVLWSTADVIVGYVRECLLDYHPLAGRARGHGSGEGELGGAEGAGQRDPARCIGEDSGRRRMNCSLSAISMSHLARVAVSRLTTARGVAYTLTRVASPSEYVCKCLIAMYRVNDCNDSDLANVPRKLVVLAHAAGFCKEMWNPVIDDLICKLPSKPCESCTLGIKI